ncbi:MAG: hypothetical protein ACTIC1_14810 [Brevibacterium sp.]
MNIVPIEDGMRKATKNLDEAAEAAPTSELVDENDFGTRNDEADASRDDENPENASVSTDDSDAANVRTDSTDNPDNED